MQKTPTLFVRDRENTNQVIWGEVTDGCDWVLDGQGTPTRKYDGTCVMFDGTQWWARREVRPGKKTPANFVEVNDDLRTGRRMGWIPLGESSFHKQHAAALAVYEQPITAGTYELCGPQIATRAGKNPENLEQHILVPHGNDVIADHTPGDVQALVLHARENGWEGIVWHHSDGRMAKLKVRDVPASVFDKVAGA